MPAATIATRASEQDPSRLEIGPIAGTEVTIADAGGYFVGGNTETVLQEVGAALAAGGGGPIDVQSIAADSQLVGSDLWGLLGETPHGPGITMAAGAFGGVRRTGRFRVDLVCDGHHWPSAWVSRVYLDAVMLFEFAWTLAAGTVLRIDGEIAVRTVGAGGSFDCQALGWLRGPAEAFDRVQRVNSGAVDTAAANVLTVTGSACNEGNAGSLVTLRQLSMEVWEA